MLQYLLNNLFFNHKDLIRVYIKKDHKHITIMENNANMFNDDLIKEIKNYDKKTKKPLFSVSLLIFLFQPHVPVRLPCYDFIPVTNSIII